MKYKTLEDLKKWPKLYEAAKWNIENTEKIGIEGELCSFVWHKSDQGRCFWEAVVLGHFVAARALHPDLFEAEKVVEFVVGNKYVVLDYDMDTLINKYKFTMRWFKPGEIVKLLKPANERNNAIFKSENGFVFYWPKGLVKPLVSPEPITEQEEKTEYKHIEYGFSSGNGFYTKVVDCEQKTERLNAAMLDRDGPEEPCNTEPAANPMAKHSDTLSRALGVDPFAITKFDSRGL